MHFTLETHRDISYLLSPQYSMQRIIPLSEARLHHVTHYKEKGSILNVQVEDVCVPNGLRYSYYDKVKKIWCQELNSIEVLPQQSLLKLQSDSTSLEKFMYRPPSNSSGASCNAPVVSALIQCTASL